VVRAETHRPAAAIRERGIDVSAVVWNRARHGPGPLPAAVTARQYCAKEVQPPTVGPTALRAWSPSWHALSPVS